MSIHRRPNSPYYWYDFVCAGKRIQCSTGVTTKRAARAIEREARKKAKRQAAIMREAEKLLDDSLRLENAALRYWEEVKDKLAGARNTKRDLAWLVQYFPDDTFLTNITDKDVANMVAARRNCRAIPPRGKREPETYPLVSPQTVNHTIVRLQALFTHAKRHWSDRKGEKIRFRAEPTWKSHKLDVPRNVVRVLDDNERGRLDSTNRSEFEDFVPIIGFATTTALRFMSCVTLRWSEVLWEMGVIEKPGKRKPGGREKIERVPITARVREILEPLKGHHPIYVFTYVAKRTRDGRIKGQRYPLTAQGTATMWKRLCAKAGVKNFGFHGLRRDRATKIWRATGDFLIVNKLLNHSDIETTMRYIGADMRDVAKAMEETDSEHTLPTLGSPH